jgi:carbon storage regulator
MVREVPAQNMIWATFPCCNQLKNQGLWRIRGQKQSSRFQTIASRFRRDDEENLNLDYPIPKIRRGNGLHDSTSRFGTGASMLVLSRKRDERIVIGENIVITVVEVRGDKVRLGIEAPSEVPVHRQEVLDAMRRSDMQPKAPPAAG